MTSKSISYTESFKVTTAFFCAGTGYGKSLVFEGLATLGGKGKLVIIISPLERDQVRLLTILVIWSHTNIFRAEQAKLMLSSSTKRPRKPQTCGNMLVPAQPRSTCRQRWLSPLSSKSYGRIPVSGHASPRSWLMRPIA